MTCAYGKFDARAGRNITCSGELTERNSLSAEDSRLFRLRSSCKIKLKRLCLSHKRKFLQNYSSHQVICCDPFNKHQQTSGTSKKRKKYSLISLSEISIPLRDRAKLIGFNLVPGKKLCVSCKASLFSDHLSGQGDDNAPQVPLFSSPSIPSSSQQSAAAVNPSPMYHSEEPSPPDAGACPENVQDKPFTESLDGINSWRSSLGMSPISRKKLQQQKNYTSLVINKILKGLESCTEQSLSAHDKSIQNFEENERKAKLYDEIIEQLKNYLTKAKDSGSKLLTLTTLPQGLSLSNIQELGVSSRLARVSKSLVKNKGILSTPYPKPGRKISVEVEEEVVKFFMRSDISCELPGRKDVVSVKVDGVREHRRKRLVLSNLSDLHEIFCKENPVLKNSGSKFASLRPKESP